MSSQESKINSYNGVYFVNDIEKKVFKLDQSNAGFKGQNYYYKDKHIPSLNSIISSNSSLNEASSVELKKGEIPKGYKEEKGSDGVTYYSNHEGTKYFKVFEKDSKRFLVKTVFFKSPNVVNQAVRTIEMLSSPEDKVNPVISEPNNSTKSENVSNKIAPEIKYSSWQDIKDKYNKINSMEHDEDKVIEWHKQNSSADSSNYVIVDKKSCQAKIYSSNGELLKSFEVGLGKQKGDDYLTKDRKMTTAGIYTINYKASGTDDYAKLYDRDIFTMETDRGETGVALHKIPKNASIAERFKRFNNKNLDDNRFSHGCINFLPEDFDKFTNYMKLGTKVYVLPEDSNNYIKLKNGQLNLTQNKYTGHVPTSVPFETAKPINIEVNNNFKYRNTKAIKFMNTLSKDKSKFFINELGIDNDTYNDLALLALGLAGQESEYGTGNKYYIKEKFQGIVSRVKRYNHNYSCNSRGMTQIKLNGFKNNEVRSLLNMYNINDKTISKPENSARATMIVLANMYKNDLPNLRKHLDTKNISDMDALLYLWQGRRRVIINEQADPDQNQYVQNIHKFSSNFNIKQQGD